MAADKKLNSVNLVNDASYVYAETASGETVKIAKADLASVVAEQMTARHNVKSGTELEITLMNDNGLYLIKNASNATDWDVVLMDYSGTITTLHKNNGNVINYGSEVDGQICIFKRGQVFIIKNNWTINASVDIRCL